MGFYSDFKKFAFKGNVIDLAVGVVIGAAFGRIVNSLVKDIITPSLGLIIAGVDFSDKKVILKPAELGSDGKVVETAIELTYGNFIQASIDFIIIAFSIFIFVRLLEKFRRKEEVKNPEVVIPNNEKLLAEIRDLLKKKKSDL
jgi:large conductance mechanosensitive channel